MGKILIIKGADFSDNAIDVLPINAPVINISNAGSVTIVDNKATAIYYTTNGSTPTTSSTQYTTAFTVAAGTTVKAISVYQGGVISNVATKVYSTGSTIPVSAYKQINGIYTSAETGQCTANAYQKGYIYVVSGGDTLRMKVLMNGTNSPRIGIRYGIYANEPTAGATAFQYEEILVDDADYARNGYAERTVSANGYLLLASYDGEAEGQIYNPLAEGSMTVLKVV